MASEGVNSDAKNEKDMLIKRMEAMLEVTQLRRKVPSAIVNIDRKIKQKELSRLVSRQFSLENIRDEVCAYVEKNYKEKRRVLDWESELCRVQENFANDAKTEVVLQHLEENRVEFSEVLKKAKRIEENLQHRNRARMQLDTENPLISESRKKVLSTLRTLKKLNVQEVNEENPVVCAYSQSENIS